MIKTVITRLLDSWKDDPHTSSLEVDITTKKDSTSGNSEINTQRHGLAEHDTSPDIAWLFRSGALDNFVCITVAGVSKKTLIEAASSLQAIVDANMSLSETTSTALSQRKAQEDSVKEDSIKEDSTKEDSTKEDSTKKQSTKEDSTKEDDTEACNDVENEPKCSICGWLPERATLLDCGHVYCLECLENLCLYSPDTSDSNGIIKCQNHGMQTCLAVPALEYLRRTLTPSKFEDVLLASFTAHVRQRITDYGHCPTPDCKNLYARIKPEDQRKISANDRAPATTCEECLQIICLRCERQHPGVTCAEFDYESSDDRKALEAFKEEAGIKDCKNCNTSIEKTYGCNHMTCAGCGSHICWVCNETFSNAIECVDHLTARHENFENGDGAAFDDNADDAESENEGDDGGDWRERLG